MRAQQAWGHGRREESGVSETEYLEIQYNAALRYVQGIRDHMLTVDWKSILYYANLLSTKKEQNDG